MKEQLIKRLIYIIIIINTSMAQFDDFDSKIALTQIRENDRFYFQDTQENINNFYTLNIFGSNLEDLGIEGINTPLQLLGKFLIFHSTADHSGTCNRFYEYIRSVNRRANAHTVVFSLATWAEEKGILPYTN